MNDRFILERIKEGKFSLITDREYKYIFSNDVLKQVLYDKLKTLDYTFEEGKKLFNKYFDYFKGEKWIYDVEYLLIEKYYFDEFLKYYLLYDNAETKDLNIKKREHYLEEVKEIILHNPERLCDNKLIITWEEIIDFIIQNNFTILYKYISFDKIDINRKDIIEERIKSMIAFDNTEDVTNIDIIEYLFENHYSDICCNDQFKYIIKINREDYTENEIMRIVNLLKENKIKNVSSKKVCRYILDNDMEDLYEYLHPNCLSIDDFKKIEKNGFKNSQRIHHFNGYTINKFSVIKCVLENGIEWLMNELSFSYLKFEEYIQIKDLLIKYVDIINPWLFFSDDGNKIAREVILSGTKELMPYIVNSYDFNINGILVEKNDCKKFLDFIYYYLEKHSNNEELFNESNKINNKYLVEYIIYNCEDLLDIIDLHNIEFNKENIYRLIELRKEGKIDYPFINSLAKRNDNEINKVIELFKERTVTESKLSVINEALQQAIYREENPEVKNIFNIIEEKALDKQLSIEEKEKYIKYLVKEFMDFDCLPRYYVSILTEKNQGMSLDLKKELFIEEMLHRVIIDNKFGTNLDVVHEITDNYVAKKANQYAKEHGLDKVPGIGFDYDIKENEKIINKDLFNYLRKHYYDILLVIIKENGYDKDDIEGPNIKIAKGIFSKWFNEEVNKSNSILPTKLQFLFKDEVFCRSLKREIIYDKRDLALYIIADYLPEKYFDIFFEKVINNNEVYQKLLEIVGKYNFLEWISIFKYYCNTLSGETIENFVSFIVYFDTIYEFRNEEYLAKMYKETIDKKYLEYVKGHPKEKMSKVEFEKKYRNEILDIVVSECSSKYTFSIVDILRDTMRFDSTNIIYRYLLGDEDFALIKGNPGNNSASKPAELSKLEFIEKRLSKVAGLALEIIDAKEVTVPSFREIITLSSGKKIKVIVGNKTSTRNLTLGERTGACMRAFGAGEGLMEFCATDPRGLHIIFEDPETGDFVSRISGFRNGNTLFLNQLRDSVSLKYSNNDLVEFLKIISRKIIDKSNAEEKEEELPIEMVVADTKFALEQEKSVIPNFDIDELTLPSYSDVGWHNIVVLATKDGQEMVEVKEKKDGQHIYLPVRAEYKTFTEYSEKALSALNRIIIIKLCREHSDDKEYYKKLTNEEKNETFKALIVSDDWAIILRDNLEIEIINVSSDERAKEEIKEAIIKMEKIKESYEKEDELANDKGKSEINR